MFIDMKQFLKIMVVLIFIINSILLILSLLYFIHGSMEMFPTEERQQGIRFVFGLFSLFFVIVEWVLFKWAKKTLLP